MTDIQNKTQKLCASAVKNKKSLRPLRLCGE
jgi:hypothetical protein